MSAIKAYETQKIIETKSQVLRDMESLKGLINHLDPEISKLVTTWLLSDYTIWAHALGLFSDQFELPYKGWFEALSEPPIKFLKYLVSCFLTARYPAILYMKRDEESWDFILTTKDDPKAQPYIIKDKYQFPKTENAEILNPTNCLAILQFYNKYYEDQAKENPEDHYLASQLYGQNPNACLWGPIIQELTCK